MELRNGYLIPTHPYIYIGILSLLLFNDYLIPTKETHNKNNWMCQNYLRPI